MFNHILVPMDGSPLAECVLPHVAALASTFEAQVTIIHVRSQPTGAGEFIDPVGWQLGRAETERYLDNVASRLARGGLKTQRVLLDGHAANSIIEYAHKHRVELIILSSHGRSGLSAWNVSGVVQKIIQRAHLPTMIVRAYQTIPAGLSAMNYPSILAPLDISQRAECILPIAVKLARQYGARLIFAHIVVQPEMPRRTAPSEEDINLAKQLVDRNHAEATKYLSQVKNRLASQDLRVETRLLVRENTASALAELVIEENVELVVMSAHGYSGETMWPYGNVVEKFIHYGSTPLLIYQDLKPEEFKQTQAEEILTQLKGH